MSPAILIWYQIDDGKIAQPQSVSMYETATIKAFTKLIATLYLKLDLTRHKLIVRKDHDNVYDESIKILDIVQSRDEPLLLHIQPIINNNKICKICG